MSNLIQLTGYSQTGTACPLPQPVFLQLSRAVDSPADGLELTLPLPQDLPPLCKVKAQLPGDILFIGEVDEEERVSSPKGELLSLFARSDGALLLDKPFPSGLTPPGSRMSTSGILPLTASRSPGLGSCGSPLTGCPRGPASGRPSAGFAREL